MDVSETVTATLIWGNLLSAEAGKSFKAVAGAHVTLTECLHVSMQVLTSCCVRDTL